MSIRKICTVFNAPGHDVCISEVMKQYASAINVQVDDAIIIAHYDAARNALADLTDERVVDMVENWLKETSELTDKQCKIVDLVRTAIGNYILYQLVQTAGTVTAAGDHNYIDAKLSPVSDKQNSRNCYYFLNRYYDAAERLIYKCLCPLLEDEDETVSELLPATGLDFIAEMQKWFIQSPAEYKRCENIKHESGGYSVFLRLATHFKHAENALTNCICPDFLGELKAFCSKFSEAEPNSLQRELIRLIKSFVANFAKYRFERVDTKTATRNGSDFIQKHPSPTSRRIYQNETVDFALNLNEEQAFYLSQIETFLNENADKPGFETYRECLAEDEPVADENPLCNRCQAPSDCGCNRFQSNSSAGGHLLI